MPSHCHNGHHLTPGIPCRPCRRNRERVHRLNDTATAEVLRAKARRYRARRKLLQGPRPPSKWKPFPKKAACLRGHARTPDNVDRQGRCRICLRARWPQYRINRALRYCEDKECSP